VGFDYKVCLWNLANPKKSKSCNYRQFVIDKLGENSMAFNPPFTYSAAIHKSNEGERLILGLGNGSILRMKKGDLKPIDLEPDLHSGQISALKIDNLSTLLTCSSADKQIGIHKLKSGG
jgi:hypothetical protein